MSAPDVFLLMDRSGIEPFRRVLQEVFASRSITTFADRIYISAEDRVVTYFHVENFDLEDYIFFSFDDECFDEILNILRRFEKPHVCRISTRDLAKLNEVALALHRQIDFVMDNDQGLLIDKQLFLRFHAEGTDWLRLAPG